MVENNQVQVFDDVVPMIVAGICDTSGDINYKLFHPILKSNSLDCDYFDRTNNECELAYDNYSEDYNWINADQSRIIISPLSLPQKQVRAHANRIRITPYYIYGVDTDRDNGYGMEK